MYSKVVITNLEAGTTMDLDARKWPDAPTDDVSAFYKVNFDLKTRAVFFYFKMLLYVKLEHSSRLHDLICF